MKPVVIVGGGLSGLAVALLLSRQNIPAILLERKVAPGGRTRSFRDPVTGDTLDNGQHALIAGYRSTFRYLEMIGTRDLVRIQQRPVLRLHHPSRGFCTVRFPLLPPPWNAVVGISRTHCLSPADRIRLLRACSILVRWNTRTERELGGLTVLDWLSMTGQSPEMRRSFWDPLVVSIMNEHSSRASASLFLRSIRQAFLDSRRSAAFALPTVGLSDLLVTPAVSMIQRLGGIVRCGAQVVETTCDRETASGVRLRDGTFVEASAVVLAVPPSEFSALLPAATRGSDALDDFTGAPQSPIVSVYLWFERECMPAEEVLGLIDRRVQWVFNRRLIAPVSASQSLKTAPPGFLCAVISAAHEFADLSNADLTKIAVEDLRSVYGPSVPPPLRAVVLRERRATFSQTPASEYRRPGPHTKVRNLLIAGDWTDTGLPATIEGALVSAERCATSLLAGGVNAASSPHGD